ncbi:MAG: alanine racemase [Christensenellales bacterium]|jgi:alanine racemase
MHPADGLGRGIDLHRMTYARVNLGQFGDNIKSIKESLHPNVMLLASVKANAYGHGIVPIAKECEALGVDYLGVAIPEEGVLLRKNDIHLPILILGASHRNSIPLIVSMGLSQAVTDPAFVLQLQQEAARQNAIARVHIKCDTGMGRIGLRNMQSIIHLAETIRNLPNVKLEGVFTHFATSDEKDKTYALQQLEMFKRLVEQLRRDGFSFIAHAANSGAILDLPEAQFDMVRAGIMIYGYYPSKEVSHSVKVHPFMSFLAYVTQIKDVEAGESIGYNRTFTTKRPTLVATVAAGYGDGYKRIFSNRAHVLVNGKRVPVIGRVSMDQITIDITHAGEVSVGDEVVLLGGMADEAIDADELAGLADTISYEILLSISERVPRIYEHGYTKH